MSDYETLLREVVVAVNWGLTDLTYTAPEDTERQANAFAHMRAALKKAEVALGEEQAKA